MVHFSYTAEKNDGEMYKGVAEAKDRFELYTIIRREGGRLLTIEEKREGMLSLTYWNARFTTVPEEEKILFVRNLGSMLGAGLPLSRALSVMERQTKNLKLKATVLSIANDIRHGETLHDALSKFPGLFPNLMFAMVHAGEEGGDLSGSLVIVAEQMERSSELKKKIRGALIYPSIILIAIFGIGALLMTQVVPTLANTFKEMHAELPHSTQIVIAISDFITAHTVSAILIVVGVILGFWALLRTTRGRRAFEFALLHIPLIGGIVREVNAARTARTMSSLLSAGVDLLGTLEIVRDVVQNTYFREVIVEAVDAVSRGEQLSAVFLKHENLYPPFVGEMMAVGEETGQTPEMLKRLAFYYESEVDRKTKDMTTVIEPFLMVFIGAVVGFFAVSMISPIYSISQNV